MVRPQMPAHFTVRATLLETLMAEELVVHGVIQLHLVIVHIGNGRVHGARFSTCWARWTRWIVARFHETPSTDRGVAALVSKKTAHWLPGLFFF